MPGMQKDKEVDTSLSHRNGDEIGLRVSEVVITHWPLAPG